MGLRRAFFLLALLSASPAAAADAALPLAAHRAAYEITLGPTDDTGPSKGQSPVSATGLLAYEFRGSACEGYASNFRQLTRIERQEGEPIASDVQSITYEDGAGKALRFDIEGHNSSGEDPPISGSAARIDDGEAKVTLLKPSKATIDLGADVLFPTQHIEHVIAAAKSGASTVHARVYDGSDTGTKVYVTLAVIGKEATKPGDDAAVSDKLAAIRRWPVSISYFDESKSDQPPDYVLSFDLYENGVSGSLKLDYGTFVLNAKLSKIEWLPVSACGK